jgi:hypothetical protein
MHFDIEQPQCEAPMQIPMEHTLLMASELQQLVKRISVQEEEAVEQMSGCEQGLAMGLCALWRSRVVSHVVWR